MMEAGREMDAEVAEKIMEWRWAGEDDHVRPLHTTRSVQVRGRPAITEDFDDYESKGPHKRLVSPEGLAAYYCGCGPLDRNDSTLVPAYSTDWAAMKLVVEKMRERGMLLTLEARLTLDAYPDGGWVAWFEETAGTGFAEGRDAPHAVCLAALEAVGHKVDAQ